jgi:hypothetical protein
VMSKKLASRLEQALAEADEIEAAERTADPDAPLPAHVKVSQPGRARSKVLQVRLNPEEMAALETIADRRELPVSTVAREQILRLLAADAEGPEQPSAMLKLSRLLLTAEQIAEYADDLRHELPSEFGLLKVRGARAGAHDARIQGGG